MKKPVGIIITLITLIFLLLILMNQARAATPIADEISFSGQTLVSQLSLQQPQQKIEKSELL